MNRAILYLLYSPRGVVPKYVAYKLQKLRPFATYIHVIVNGSIDEEGKQKLESIVDRVHIRKNVGLDVGGYQEAIRAIGYNELAGFDEVILMNYTWYGPIQGSFEPIFKRFDGLSVDFWGMTEHGRVTPNPITGKGVMHRHLQSHWIAVRKKMLESDQWKKYWETMPQIKDYSDSILRHESYFTNHFHQLGFDYAAAFTEEEYGVDHAAFICANQLMKDGCPVLKRRPFFHDPLYLDAEAIIGRDLILTASESGYPVELIWDDLLPLTPPKILNTNASQLKILPDSYTFADKYYGKIAAVVHIFYEEMASELFEKLSFIPGVVDVFVTTTDEAKAELIQEAFDRFSWRPNHFEIRIMPSNRGRDLSSYFIECKDVVSDYKYDLIFKIHSKKTIQRGATAGAFFKRQQVDNLLYSRDYVRNLVSLFENDNQLGIVFPPTIHIGFPTLGMAWFSNKEPAIEYAKRLGIQVPFDSISPLGAFGAMWVCRPAALSMMLGEEYSYIDYTSEQDHGDGSLAHVQERMVAYAAAESGFKTITVANSEYIEISHTYLEYKLDQALAVMPGYALHTIDEVRSRVWDSDALLDSLNRRQYLKNYLKVHHPTLGRILLYFYLPIRKIKTSRFKIE